MNNKDKKKAPYLLGAHFSIAKGLHNAVYKARTYGCNTLQIFTKNASSWKEREVSQDEIELFTQAKTETGIHTIASHTSYLINPASPEKKKHAMSCHALKEELVRSSRLDIPFVVLHPGSHMGKGEEYGIDRIVESIKEIIDEIPDRRTRILFETTAGQGFSVGHTFEQLASILEKIADRDRLGICLDTCHVFAAGYDIRSEASYDNTISTFDSTIGLEHLYLIHLNDSKKKLGSRIDRHEHIGQGFIGLKAFALFMNDKKLSDIPKIIETPDGKGFQDWDRFNIEKLRTLTHTNPKDPLL